MFDPSSEGIQWICYAVGAFCWHGLGPLLPLEERVTVGHNAGLTSYKGTFCWFFFLFSHLYVILCRECVFLHTPRGDNRV